MEENSIINQCSIVLTRNCNLRCSFCYVKDAGYCPSESISYNNLKKIVDFCSDASVKYIFFTGGEPLLYPHLKDILRYIKEKRHSITTAVASNGILLEDKKFCRELIDSGLDYIDISMKGKTQEEWVNFTGYDGCVKQQSGIRNLSEMQVDFTCSMVVTLENVFSVCDIVRLAFENGAKQFSFTFVIDNNKSNNENGDYLSSHNPFRLIELFISQIEELNSITDDWWIEYSFPLCVYTEKQLNLLKGRLASPCQIHKKNAITVDTQMNLLPCDMYFDRKIGRIGEDFNSIEEFNEWRKHGTYKETIDEISHRPSDTCLGCTHLDDCFGGCPVLWNNYSFDDLCSYKRSQE
ncbi:radical SAM protein [Lachnospiraceae bacterium C1.1]|nr:radical SAM protein [Lachnospiraceae bacterium C1.1]